MKKILYALTAIIFLSVACKSKSTEDSQVGVYKMDKLSLDDGKTDTTYSDPHQVKFYTATHYVYANFNDDSTASFGTGTYQKNANVITETNLYNSGGNDSANNFILNITKTKTGYIQVIPSMLMQGVSYKMSETYSSVGTDMTSDLDGLWKQTSNMVISGKDTTIGVGAQYKIYQGGHFLYINRYPTDSTNSTYKTGCGFGTFTYSNGLSTETNSMSTFSSQVGVAIPIKITFNTKDEYSQVIVDEKTKDILIENYTRL